MWIRILNFLKGKSITFWLNVIVALCFILIIPLINSHIKNLNKQLEIYKNNEKAIISENDSLKNTSKVYQLSIEQLSYLNDSITHKLNTALYDLKVQKKNVKQLQYILNNTKTDTLVLNHRDTIFRTPEFIMDTTLTDNKWYSVNLNMTYPSTIKVLPEFNNEFIIVTSAKKECVNTPKKFFLWRVFQKKHTVLEAVITDNNPYSKVKDNRFINIIK